MHNMSISLPLLLIKPIQNPPLIQIHKHINPKEMTGQAMLNKHQKSPYLHDSSWPNTVQQSVLLPEILQHRATSHLYIY